MSNLIIVENLSDNRSSQTELSSEQTFTAQVDAVYTVINKETGKSPANAINKRNGDDLEILVDDEIVATIEGFYSIGMTASYDVDGSPLAAANVADNESIENTEPAVWQAEETTAATESSDDSGGVPWWGYALGGVGLAAAGGGGGSSASPGF